MSKAIHFGSFGWPVGAVLSTRAQASTPLAPTTLALAITMGYSVRRSVATFKLMRGK
jgi:hypothetical protein